MTPLTPPHHAELEQVSPDVDVEDSDQQKIEVEPLQGHPAERGQQGIVKRESHVKAQPRGGQHRLLVTGEEVQVEEDQGNGEVDVDPHGDIGPDFSVRQKRIDPMCRLFNCVQITLSYHGGNDFGVEEERKVGKEKEIKDRWISFTVGRRDKMRSDTRESTLLFGMEWNKADNKED